MTEATFLDRSGMPAPEVHAGVACCTVADLPGGPVACALSAGHRDPHAWVGLEGAPTGSKVPGKEGASRTLTARAAAARSAGGRKVGINDLCAKPSGSGALLCAYQPGHKAAHSWSEVA